MVKPFLSQPDLASQSIAKTLQVKMNQLQSDGKTVAAIGQAGKVIGLIAIQESLSHLPRLRLKSLSSKAITRL